MRLGVPNTRVPYAKDCVDEALVNTRQLCPSQWLECTSLDESYSRVDRRDSVISGTRNAWDSGVVELPTFTRLLTLVG